MVRSGFRIRARTGHRVPNILILAASLIAAERRLRQMHVECEILERREQNVRAHDSCMRFSRYALRICPPYEAG